VCLWGCAILGCSQVNSTYTRAHLLFGLFVLQSFSSTCAFGMRVSDVLEGEFSIYKCSFLPPPVCILKLLTHIVLLGRAFSSCSQVNSIYTCIHVFFL